MNWLVRFWILNSIVLGLCAMVDETFRTGEGPNHFVEQVLPLKDGSIFVVGDFTEYDGQPRRGIAKLKEDGTLDRTWTSRVYGWVRHMLIQPDGKIIIAGAFTQVDDSPRSLIARLNPDGSLDKSFNPGTGATEKLTPSDPNPPLIFWSALQPDGKILIAGSFAKYNGQTARGVARINQDGSLDTTFKIGNGIDSWGRFVNVLPNNQIILTGWFTSYNGFSCNRMVKLNPDGTPDASFKPYFGDKTAIYSALLLPDGNWLVSGHSKNTQGLFTRGLARLFPDGKEDPAFVGRTNERTESILMQGDGKFWVCGWFDKANGDPRGRLARFNADGTLDTITPWADYFIWSMAFDRNGNLLVGGGFTTFSGVPTYGLARLNVGLTQLPTPPASPVITIQKLAGGVQISCQSEFRHNYTLEKQALGSTIWTSFPSVEGTGSVIKITDTGSSAGACYRVMVE